MSELLLLVGEVCANSILKHRLGSKIPVVIGPGLRAVAADGAKFT
jgi:hypothetical protein